MNSGTFSRFYRAIFLLLFAFFTGCGGASPVIIQQTAGTFYIQNSNSLSALKGKTASLSWIFGRDCSHGLSAYLQSATTNPDAALVGNGWVNPLDGTLIVGNNNCEAASHSMDSVIQLIHSKGGMAYLTITMETEGADAWTYQQAAAYIDKATTTPSYIDAIVQEVQRAGYDGVIMDLEGVDHTYPSIQQLFATYNQKVREALRSLNKVYGIALISKLSDNDGPNALNNFENWHLLRQSADFLVIMAVDLSYYTPGPTVSLPWLKQLLAYARQTMPEMLSHIIWELPLYGNNWHWENGNWVIDGQITFQAAQTIVQQLTAGQIDAANSDLNDSYAPHIVYTDKGNVKHSLWYPNAKALYTIITNFWQLLEKEPQFANNHLMLAFWWRTTTPNTPNTPLLDKLYP